MRLAILSDIHGNLPALDAVLADIDRERKVDAIINAGDILSGPLLPAETAERLMGRREIAMVAGNNDRQVLTLPIDSMGAGDAYAAKSISAAQREWLMSAPATRWMGEEVFVCHGTPTSDEQYLMETVTDDFGKNGSPGIRAATRAELCDRLGRGPHTKRARVIVCGHSHVPRVTTATIAESEWGAILVVNPGSVGLPSFDDTSPYPYIVETCSPHARYAVVSQTPAGWSAELHCVAYDFEPMAKMAESRGQPGWARALRTGSMRQ